MYQNKNQLPQPLRELLAMPGVTDVLVDGAASCHVDSGQGLVLVPNPFESDQELNRVIADLAYENGARLDISKPMADFMIGTIRFHAVLPFGVSKIPLLSIRKHPEAQIRLEHLSEVGLFDAGQEKAVLELISSRANILISGPTSVGKTTLLSALIAETKDRVICIEQMAELSLRAPAISLLERSSNQEGAGHIPLDQLVVEALRMRPDRIVVGEVRGSELSVLLQAMNNGHSGTMATLHAKSLADVPNRLLMLGLLSGLTQELTQQMVLGSIDAVIQLGRRQGVRKIVGIGKPVMRNSNLEMQPLYSEQVA
jgi:pilus assembly protein CpaF